MNTISFDLHANVNITPPTTSGILAEWTSKYQPDFPKYDYALENGSFAYDGFLVNVSESNPMLYSLRNTTGSKSKYTPGPFNVSSIFFHVILMQISDKRERLSPSIYCGDFTCSHSFSKTVTHSNSITTTSSSSKSESFGGSWGASITAGVQASLAPFGVGVTATLSATGSKSWDHSSKSEQSQSYSVSNGTQLSTTAITTCNGKVGDSFYLQSIVKKVTVYGYLFCKIEKCDPTNIVSTNGYLRKLYAYDRNYTDIRKMTDVLNSGYYRKIDIKLELFPHLSEDYALQADIGCIRERNR